MWKHSYVILYVSAAVLALLASLFVPCNGTSERKSSQSEASEVIVTSIEDFSTNNDDLAGFSESSEPSEVIEVGILSRIRGENSGPGLMERIRGMFKESYGADSVQEAYQDAPSEGRKGLFQRIRERRAARRAGRSRGGGFQRQRTPDYGVDTSRLAGSEADSVEFAERSGRRFGRRQLFGNTSDANSSFGGFLSP